MLRLNFHLDSRTTQRYKHQPLDDARAQIRLLKLHPGTGRLQGELFTIRLDDPARPQYEPLSYCWGSQERLETILLDGKAYSVGRSLCKALKRLRYPDTPRVIWCDVLCIDQSNTGEKNLQIPLMRHIYQNGFRTLVWLGEHDRRTKGLFRMIETLERHLMAEPNAQVPAYKWRTLYQSNQNILSWIRPLNSIIQFVRDAQGEHELASLGQKAWMHRVWVIQEAAVSNQITVFCGKYSTQWETIVRAHTVSDSEWDFDFSNIICQRDSFQTAEYQSLIALVSESLRSRATDPRDHIYGILGLLDPESGLEKEIEPDYGGDPLEVFHNTTKLSLKNSRDLNTILMGGRERPENLPSWAWYPYYTENVPPPGWQLWNKEDLRATMSSVSDIIFVKDDMILKLRGYVFGTVSKVSPGAMPVDGPVGFQSFHRIYKSLLAYFHARSVAGVESESPYVDGGMTCKEAFYRSMIMLETLKATDPSTQALLDMAKELDELVCEKLDFLLEKPETRSRFAAALQVWPRIAELTWRFAFGKSETRCLEVLRAHAHLVGYRAVSTSEGYFGLALGPLRAGDKLVLLRGVRVPVVLRRSNGNWKIICEIYVAGAMLGELWDETKCYDIMIE